MILRSISTAAAISGLMFLAACNNPPAETTPAPAEPAPTAPAPIADNVLTAEGLGAARIGMTKAELTAAWGDDANPGAVGGADPEDCDEYHPARAPQNVNVMIQNGRLTRITLVRDAAIDTDRGFGPGDQASAVKAAYGTGLIAQPHKYWPAPAEDLFAWARGGSAEYVQDTTARGIRYEINAEGRVQAVHAGDPSIQLVEGCS